MFIAAPDEKITAPRNNVAAVLKRRLLMREKIEKAISSSIM